LIVIQQSAAVIARERHEVAIQRIIGDPAVVGHGN
jgi:hypothetical protein